MIKSISLATALAISLAACGQPQQALSDPSMGACPVTLQPSKQVVMVNSGYSCGDPSKVANGASGGGGAGGAGAGAGGAGGAGK